MHSTLNVDKFRYVFDVDGTITIVGGDRLTYIRNKQHDKFHDMCDQDEPKLEIVTLVKDLRHICERGPEKSLVFCTARPERIRQKTVDWIRKYIGIEEDDYLLLMRPDNNKEKDFSIKPKLLLPYKDEVIMIFEDRTQMVKQWRDEGYVCAQIATGNY